MIRQALNILYSGIMTIILRHPLMIYAWLFLLVPYIYMISGNNLWTLFIFCLMYIVIIYIDDHNFKKEIREFIKDEFDNFLRTNFSDIYCEYEDQGGESPLEEDFVVFAEKDKKRKYKGKCIKYFHTLHKKLKARIEIFPVLPYFFKDKYSELDT